jgi:hypothetical protein
MNITYLSERDVENDITKIICRCLSIWPECGPPEFFWFCKAGFNTARLLEEQQKWEAAAAIYEKLVAANGPRSEEANARLGQIASGAFSLAITGGN